MKYLKNIAFATLITLFVISCKKQDSEKTQEISTQKTEIAAENLANASLTIEGMTCEIGCAKTIESKLATSDGVSEAKVDFKSKIATVTFDKTKQNTQSLTKIVEKIGGGDLYKVTASEK